MSNADAACFKNLPSRLLGLCGLIERNSSLSDSERLEISGVMQDAALKIEALEHWQKMADGA